MQETLPQDSLYPWRKKAADRFQDLWSLKNLKKFFPYIPSDFLALPKAVESMPLWVQKGSSPYRCVFIDGFFDADQSHFPPGIMALPLEEAMQSYGIFIQQQMKRLSKEEDPFVTLNGAFHGKGLFLYVLPEYKSEGFFSIHYHFTTSQMTAPRLHVYMAPQAQMKMIQSYSFSDPSFFCTSVCEVLLAPESRLELYDLQAFSFSSRFFASTRVEMKEKSSLYSLSLMKGAKTARSSYHVQLTEPSSRAVLQGLVFLQDGHQNHVRSKVEHLAPESFSQQLFKGVLDGQSRSSFQGSIRIEPNAQKTESYQRSENLLLNPDAESFVQPHLEIFADDVKASHGATIAKITDEELFYFRARGLTVDLAKKWRVRGFCSSLVEQMPETLKRELPYA